DPIPWQMNEYFEFYQKLNQLKSTNNALLNGDKGAKMQRISSESNALYAFVRDSGTNKVVVFLNLSDGEIELTINSELLNGDYTNLFDEKNVTFGSEVPINLSSWEYQVFYN